MITTQIATLKFNDEKTFTHTYNEFLNYVFAYWHRVAYELCLLSSAYDM